MVEGKRGSVREIRPAPIEIPTGLDASGAAVRTGWFKFAELHKGSLQKERLRQLEVSELISLANNAQTAAAAELRRYYEEKGRISPEYSIRRLDEASVKQLIAEVGGQKSGARYLAMRHGAEALNKDLALRMKAISEQGLSKDELAAEQKRQMMQLPNNLEDPVKEESLIEAVGMGVVLRYIQAVSGKQVVLRSSEFYRAQQPAKVMAAVLETRMILDQRLNSLSYKSPGDPLPNNEGTLTEELLKEVLPKGTIPLDREKIDRLGKLWPPTLPTDKGDGIYDRLQSRIKSAMDDLLNLPDADVVYVDVTHTQQHDFAAMWANYRGFADLRLAELGLLVFKKEGGHLHMAMNKTDFTKPFDGILANKAESVTQSELETELQNELRIKAAELIIEAGEIATKDFRRQSFSPRSRFLHDSSIGFQGADDSIEGSDLWIFPKALIDMGNGHVLPQFGHKFMRMGVYAADGKLISDPEELAHTLISTPADLRPLAVLHKMQERGAVFPTEFMNRVNQMLEEIHIATGKPLYKDGESEGYGIVFDGKKRGHIIRVVSDDKNATGEEITRIMDRLVRQNSNGTYFLQHFDRNIRAARLVAVHVLDAKQGKVQLEWRDNVFDAYGKGNNSSPFTFDL